MSKSPPIGLIWFLLLAAPLAPCGCAVKSNGAGGPSNSPSRGAAGQALNRQPLSDNAAIRQIVEAALEQTRQTVGYDPSYVKLGYPGGDVSPEAGVCSDVVVRAFRQAGVDLQKEIHEDISKHFKAYPNNWGAKRPDSNIDHRRVPNLMKYFERQGKSAKLTRTARDYVPGDLVAWDLGGGVLHIGLVTDALAAGAERYMLVHNIGNGARLEDVLFSWKIIGHYRCFK